MKKIRILAVEDDPIQQELLRIALAEMGYDLVDLVDNSTEAIQLLLAIKPDIVLMDIQISGNLDGIELAQKMNQYLPVPIIFTTSFSDQRVVDRARKTEPYGYVLKPFSEMDLQIAIEMAVYRFKLDQERLQEIKMSDQFSWQEDLLMKDSFFTKQGARLVKIPYEDVLWIEVNKDRYCKVKTKTESFMLRMSLKEFAERLPGKLFIQVHRAYIVNTKYVESIDQYDNLVEICGTSLPMGPSFRDRIIKKLNIL